MTTRSFTWSELRIIYSSLQDSMSVIRKSSELGDDEKEYLTNQLRDVSHKVMVKMEEIEDAGSC